MNTELLDKDASIERDAFHKRMQREKETVECFVTDMVFLRLM